MRNWIRIRNSGHTVIRFSTGIYYLDCFITYFIKYRYFAKNGPFILFICILNVQELLVLVPLYGTYLPRGLKVFFLYLNSSYLIAFSEFLGYVVLIIIFLQCEEGDSSLDRPEGSSCTDITDEILEEVEVKQEINKVPVRFSPGSISDPHCWEPCGSFYSFFFTLSRYGRYRTRTVPVRKVPSPM